MRTSAGLLVLIGCSESGFHTLDKPTETDTGVVDPEPEEDTTPPTTPTTPTTPTEPEPDPEPVEPVADAGPDLNLVARDPAFLDGTASYDPAGDPIVAWQWTLVSAPAGSASSLLVTDAPTAELVTDVDGVYELELTVQSLAGLWDTTPDRVVVVAEPAPPVADAGVDAVYPPLELVRLDGTASFDPGGYAPLAYAWTLLSVPLNSTATLDDPTAAQPTFRAELAGEYVAELSVTNTLGLVDPTPDIVVITTTPPEGFYVELSWQGQGDLDLHLLNSAASAIFDCPDDCNYDRPNPNWGGPGPDDDPSLDEDTIPGVSGLGPEIITIEAPADDVYTVLAHYYGRNGTASCANCPDADATVNVYLGGVLAATYDTTLFEDDDVWEVATIEIPSGLVTEIGVMSSTNRQVCF